MPMIISSTGIYWRSMVERNRQPKEREIEAKGKCLLTDITMEELLQIELPWEHPLPDWLVVSQLHLLRDRGQSREASEIDEWAWGFIVALKRAPLSMRVVNRHACLACTPALRLPPETLRACVGWVARATKDLEMTILYHAPQRGNYRDLQNNSVLISGENDRLLVRSLPTFIWVRLRLFSRGQNMDNSRTYLYLANIRFVRVLYSCGNGRGGHLLSSSA